MLGPQGLSSFYGNVGGPLGSLGRYGSLSGYYGPYGSGFGSLSQLSGVYGPQVYGGLYGGSFGPYRRPFSRVYAPLGPFGHVVHHFGERFGHPGAVPGVSGVTSVTRAVVPTPTGPAVAGEVLKEVVKTEEVVPSSLPSLPVVRTRTSSTKVKTGVKTLVRG